MAAICTRELDQGRDNPWFGACPECGHTIVLHPGPHNTSLTECALCAMTVFQQEFEHAARSWLDLLAAKVQPSDPGREL